MNLSDRSWFQAGVDYRVNVAASLNGIDFFNLSEGTDCFITTTQSRNSQTGYNTEKQIQQNTVLYPNPTKGYVEIKTKDIVIGVEVYSSTGKVLILGDQNKNHINLSNYSQGMYFIKITTNKGEIFKRIIKN